MRTELLPLGLSIVLMALAAQARGDIAFGQIDDFADGTFQNWQAGANNPNGPNNISSGGPTGSGDRYLLLASDGAGSGGRLVAFNSEQWAGDYLGATVSAIKMQVNNFGTTDLVLRLILRNTVQVQSVVTQDVVSVPAGSGWTLASFSLAPENLAGGPYENVMGNVTELNLVHSPDAVLSRDLAPPVVAQLGLDDITAVPEPSTLCLSVLGLAVLLFRARRRPRDL